MSFIMQRGQSKICIKLLLSYLSHLSPSSDCQCPDSVVPDVKIWSLWNDASLIESDLSSPSSPCFRSPSSQTAAEAHPSLGLPGWPRPRPRPASVGLKVCYKIRIVRDKTWHGKRYTLVTVRALRYNAAKLPHFYNAWPRSQVTDECRVLLFAEYGRLAACLGHSLFLSFCWKKYFLWRGSWLKIEI